MASGPITSWQIDGETMEIVRDFIFLGSKITADDDCSHEIKRCLLLERKVITNLGSILKNGGRYYYANKGLSSQAMVFPVVMYGCELDHKGWMPKNWCFWTVVLEKTLESSLDSKRILPVNPKGNQSWIFIHWKDWCWSWSSNTLTTWCKEPTHWKRPWCWERLRAGGEGDDRGWDGWMASLTEWT